MEFSRKRANKRQKETLVERLHANMEVVRGNSAEPSSQRFWVQVAQDLNKLGCQRTVDEWIKVWDSWVVKTKTKARKLRDFIGGTGGVPAMAGLDPTEEKIVEIVGQACIYGFTTLEVGLPSSSDIQPSNLRQSSPPIMPSLDAEPPLMSPAPANSHQNTTRSAAPTPSIAPGPSSFRRTLRARRRTRPTMHENLVATMISNNQALTASIERASNELAAAVRENGTALIRAAELLAAALAK